MKINTHWEKVLDLEYYTEGPGLDAEGNLYFTTLTGGMIMKIDRTGEVFEWARIHCPNGQRILNNGYHLVCDTLSRGIVELDSNGNIVKSVVQGTCAHHSFDAPNDLIPDAIGGFYFTDSVRHTGQVFYVGSDGEEKRLLTDLDYPNGIALSDDEQMLYIAESYTNRILVAELADPGVLRTEMEVFVDLPANPHPLDPKRMPFTANLPDGIAFDNQGRLWVAHYGMGALQVIDSTGKLIGSIPTGIPATSNLCFSTDYKSIYVTGGSGEPGPGMIHQIFLGSLSSSKS